MKIRTGIFTDNYIISTKKEWPKEASFNAGGGSIDNIGKEIFFEAFLKDYYVRGVGDNVVEAENNAWNKYIDYESCDHLFERMSDSSNIGVCSKCKLKKHNQFKIMSKCFCCGIIGASHHFKSNIYCYEDYKKNVSLFLSENHIEEELNISNTALEKSLWIYEKLEELDLLKNLNDEEINRAYFDYKNGYFEYLLLTCQIYWNKHKNKSYIYHYVDVYDKIEAIKDIYIGMFEVYLVENKGVTSSNSLNEYKKQAEDFIRLEVK